MRNPLFFIDYFMPMLTVFLSGLFGLLVAIVTWRLASQREKEKFKQELAYREFKEMEDLYASLLSTADMIVRFTKAGKDYAELFNDLTLVMAKSQLLASNTVNDKFSELSEIIYEWSTEYRNSLPEKIGDTNFGIASTKGVKHREKADELFPELKKIIGDLVEIIKEELTDLKKAI